MPAGQLLPPAGGGTFWFTARLAPAPDEETVERPVPAALPAGTVLVVEDEPVNRRIASLMLQRLGVEVRTATDGFEALALIADGGIDLVLMDMQMPGLDGPGTTQRLRAREVAEGTERTTVVALSAAAFAEDRRRCLDSGMDAFLAKPLGLEELRAALARHLVGAVA